MIRRLFIFVLSAAMLIGGAGCVGVNFSTVSSEMVFGKGPMVTTEYVVEPYMSVEINSGRKGMELYYTAQDSDKVTIEVQENLAELLNVSVEDGVLIIKTDKLIESENGKTPKLYISAPTLEKLSVAGGLVIKQADIIKADSFSLNISGGVDGTLPIEVTKLDVGVSGACSLSFSGSADEVGIWTSGASSINAASLQAKKVSVNISGAGDVNVACSDELDVNISGTGNVSYKGDPKVTQKLSGAASVNRMD